MKKMFYPFLARLVILTGLLSVNTAMKVPVPVPVTESASKDSHIDLSNGIRLWGTQQRLQDELVEFWNEHENCAEELRQMLQNLDWLGLQQTAHRLCGLTGNLGLKNVYPLLGRLEKAANHQNSTLSLILLDELEQGMKDCYVELERLQLSSSGVSISQTEVVEEDSQLLDPIIEQLKHKCELAEIDTPLIEQFVRLVLEKQKNVARQIAVLLHEFNFKQAQEALKQMQMKI